MLLRAAVLLAILGGVAAEYDYQWHQGRATFYGTDGWSIHKGNCGFGFVWKDEPLGWDVAAVTDSSRELPFVGSCGRCYEVACDNRSTKDGFGTQIDRTNACYDSQASVVVRIVDSCPCVYSGNVYSNKRWCCGDAAHLDLSIWAFEKLAPTKWGVIPLRWRAVPCNHQPATPAPPLATPTPGEDPPSGAQNPADYPQENLAPTRTWSQQQGSDMKMYAPFATYAEAMSAMPSGSTATSAASTATTETTISSSSASGSTSVSAPSGASASSAASASAQSTATASASSTAPAGWAGGSPSSMATALQGWAAAASQAGRPLAGSSSQPANQPGMQNNGRIFDGGLQNGWWDKSWSAKVNWSAGRFGATGGMAMCADISQGGALSVGHAKGFFQGAKSIEFWVKTDQGKPQVAINIGVDQKGCQPQELKALPSAGEQNGWTKYAFSLGQFGSSYDRFNGCGGSGSWDISWLEFKNLAAGQQTVCIDLIQLRA